MHGAPRGRVEGGARVVRQKGPYVLHASWDFLACFLANDLLLGGWDPIQGQRLMLWSTFDLVLGQLLGQCMCLVNACGVKQSD